MDDQGEGQGPTQGPSIAGGQFIAGSSNAGGLREGAFPQVLRDGGFPGKEASGEDYYAKTAPASPLGQERARRVAAEERAATLEQQLGTLARQVLSTANNRAVPTPSAVTNGDNDRDFFEGDPGCASAEIYGAPGPDGYRRGRLTISEIPSRQNLRVRLLSTWQDGRRAYAEMALDGAGYKALQQAVSGYSSRRSIEAPQEPTPEAARDARIGELLQELAELGDTTPGASVPRFAAAAASSAARNYIAEATGTGIQSRPRRRFESGDVEQAVPGVPGINLGPEDMQF